MGAAVYGGSKMVSHQSPPFENGFIPHILFILLSRFKIFIHRMGRMYRIKSASLPEISE
jgi:hypothetical protein